MSPPHTRSALGRGALTIGRLLLASGAAVALLAACGQKGPLYLPDHRAGVVTRSAPAAASQPQSSSAPQASSASRTSGTSQSSSASQSPGKSQSSSASQSSSSSRSE